MSRWLGIDHGTVRIGLAVGDTSLSVASPVGVIPAEPAADAIAKIKSAIAEYGVEGIVVGWPLNMDDTEGPQGKLARTMADQLAEVTKLDVRLWDERLSSFTADQALAGQLTRKKRRARQDGVAAAMILQEFLSSGGPDSIAPRPGDVGKK